MTNETSAQLAPGFAEAIAAAAEAANLPKPQRMKQHRKNLRAIAFYQGIEGVKEYKEQFPEAAPIRVDLNAIAYSPKPKGYGDYLAGLAERWAVTEAAVNATNRADVERLNDRLDTTFPPDKHFSEKLSMGLRKKIKTVLARHGIPLDIDQATTMSRVRALIRAAKTRISSERRLGRAGVISGGVLVMGDQPFPIERNGERECIRVTINGKRRRLYLDELEWIADLLVEDQQDPLITATVRSMGELAYSTGEGENAGVMPTKIPELAYTENPAMREDEPLLAPCTGYIDPLELDWTP